MPVRPESKALVLERAAATLNERGYWGTSMADLARICGTSKGMIYGHFSSKEELASAAFDRAAGETRAAVDSAVGVQPGPLAWLHAFVDAWDALNVRPPMPGGCPVMRVATEAPEVRRSLGPQARNELASWISRLECALRSLEEAGIAREGLEPRAEAEFIFASLEGAGLMARVNGSAECSHRVTALLHAHLDSLVAVK
jgi:AcrR family transcriptional regulator